MLFNIWRNYNTTLTDLDINFNSVYLVITLKCILLAYSLVESEKYAVQKENVTEYYGYSCLHTLYLLALNKYVTIFSLTKSKLHSNRSKTLN